MIVTNTQVIFKYDFGNYSLPILCSQIRLGLEFIGDVEEDINFSLVEDYDGVRVTVAVSCKLHSSQSIWMSGFLSSDSKILEIDGVDIEVVNDMKKIDFELWDDLSYAIDIEMKFKRKSTGLVQFSSPSSATMRL